MELRRGQAGHADRTAAVAAFEYRQVLALAIALAGAALEAIVIALGFTEWGTREWARRTT